MGLVIRNPKSDEIAELKKIWGDVFGEEGSDSFFELAYSPEGAIVAERGGEPAAMGYLVPAGELMCDSSVSGVPCAMLYAIGTLPMHRGNGLGAAVTNALISAAFDLGYGAAVLCPTGDSLFEFYGSKTEMRQWFYAGERIVEGAGFDRGLRVAPSRGARRCAMTEMTEVTPKRYGALRESLLQGTAHIRHSEVCILYQDMLCRELGGGLFQIGGSCAAVEVQTDGEVWVKEMLLAPGDAERGIINAVSAAFPADRYLYRFPSSRGGAMCESAKRFAMIAAKGQLPTDNSSCAPWYGLAFD